MVRYSFPVGLFHSLLHAGLSRRTWAISVAMWTLPRGGRNIKRNAETVWRLPESKLVGRGSRNRYCLWRLGNPPGLSGSVSSNAVYRPERTTSHQRGRSVEWICGPTPPWRRKRRSSFETEFCNGPGSKTEARDNPILLCVETEIRGAENPGSRSSGGCLKTCPLHTVKAVRAG